MLLFTAVAGVLQGNVQEGGLRFWSKVIVRIVSFNQSSYFSYSVNYDSTDLGIIFDGQNCLRLEIQQPPSVPREEDTEANLQVRLPMIETKILLTNSGTILIVNL